MNYKSLQTFHYEYLWRHNYRIIIYELYKTCEKYHKLILKLSDWTEYSNWTSTNWTIIGREDSGSSIRLIHAALSPGNYVLIVHVYPVLAETQALGQNQAMSAKGKNRARREDWCVCMWFTVSAFQSQNVIAVFVTSTLFVLDILCLFKLSLFIL